MPDPLSSDGNAAPVPVAAKMDYQPPPPSSHLSSRRFALLLALICFNTVLLVSERLVPWFGQVRQWLASRTKTSAVAPDVAPASAGSSTAAGDDDAAQTAASSQPADQPPAETPAQERQRRAAHAEPADTIVYTEREEDAAAALSAAKGWRRLSADEMFQTSKSPPQAGLDWRAPWIRTPPVKVAHHQVQTEGLIFCHRLTSPSGYARLVCLWVAPQVDWEYSGNGYSIRVDRVLRCKTYFPAPFGEGRPMRMWEAKFDFPPDPLAQVDFLDGPPKVRQTPETRLRFYAGQVDPKDPSAFLIRFDRGGRSGTLTGRLADDNKVTLGGDMSWNSSGSSPTPVQE
jgi:hypothetical protein